MSHLKGLIVVAVIAGAMAFAWIKYDAFLSQGREAPIGTKILNKMSKEGVADFEMSDIHGKRVKLSEFKDSVVIVSFWASWCEPCVAEFPSFLEMIEHYKGKVVLIAVSSDYEREDLDNFLKAFDASSPYLHVTWDKDRKLAETYGTFKLPESYVIGRKLNLIRKVAGVEDWSDPGALAYFDEILKNEGL